MTPTRSRRLAALAAAVVLAWAAPGFAQNPSKKDADLEEILKKAEAPRSKDADSKDKAKPADKDKPAASKPGDKPTPTPKPGAVANKDKDLDDFLGKLDEKDAPNASGAKTEPPPSAGGEKSDKPSPGGGGEDGEKSDKPKPSEGGRKSASKPSALTGEDKDLDQHLAGEKKKSGQKKQGQQGQGQGQGQKGEDEQDGPMGDLVKQMRDVEERLGKPDTGDETRQRQGDIVKKLDGLIEQMKDGQGQSVMRQLRSGRKPGQQTAQTGNNPGQPPMMKPITKTPTPLGVKDASAWGHLPDALKVEMENVFKEDLLPARKDQIKQYYIAVSKKGQAKGE